MNDTPMTPEQRAALESSADTVVADLMAQMQAYTNAFQHATGIDDVPKLKSAIRTALLNVARGALEDAASTVEALRDSHCAGTQSAPDPADRCHIFSSHCEFVVAWNDAATAIRTLSQTRAALESKGAAP